MGQLSHKAVARLRRVEPEQSGRSSTTWQAVRDEVLSRIRSREWAPGNLIPTEKQLATEWGCARATVNRALRDLADSGIVERRRKVGTRVSAAPSLQSSREVSAIRDEIRATGAMVGYRLLHDERVAAPAEVARHLQLREGEPVHYVNSLFTADDDAYCCQTIWLNVSALPALENGVLVDGSADEWLEHVAQPNHGRVAILSRPINRQCADAIQVQPGLSVLTIERTDWSDTTPLAFSRQYYPPGHRLVYED